MAATIKSQYRQAVVEDGRVTVVDDMALPQVHLRKNIRYFIRVRDENVFACAVRALLKPTKIGGALNKRELVLKE